MLGGYETICNVYRHGGPGAVPKALKLAPEAADAMVPMIDRLGLAPSSSRGGMTVSQRKAGLWVGVLTATLVAGFALPASAFQNHRAAAVDQYGTPTPTPAATATVAPAAVPGPTGTSGRASGTGTNAGPGFEHPGGGRGNGSEDPASGGGAGSEDPGVAGDVVGGGSGVLPLADSQGGSLPFTGLDLVVLVYIGVLLLVAGFIAKLIERRRRSDG